MFKRILPVLAVCLALVIMGGCACDGGTAIATPSPTMNPTNTPMSSPETSMEPNTSEQPNTSPDLNGEAASIPNFNEGTEVKDTDVPKVTQAVKEKYPNAEIVSIKHAKQAEKQVYAVVIKTSGAEETVYVQPDGTLAEDAGTATPKQ